MGGDTHKQVEKIKRDLERFTRRVLEKPVSVAMVLLAFVILAILGGIWFVAGLNWNRPHPPAYWSVVWSATGMGVGMLFVFAGERLTPAARLMVAILALAGWISFITIAGYIAFVYWSVPR